MEKGKNKNYQRIDRLIVSAYNEILKSEGSADMSITSLCKKANVNRTTFYKHYKGVYEITNKLESELINILTKNPKIHFIDFVIDPKPILESLNKTITSDVDYYRIVFRPERIRYIVDKCSNIIYEDVKNNNPEIIKIAKSDISVKINIGFFIGATVNLYLQWLSGFLNTDINNISNCVCRVLKELFKK